LKSKVCEKFYVGISQNPIRRLEYHNTIEKGFTSRYRPWRIVFKKEYKTRVDAHSAEMKIKDWKSKTAINKILCGQIEV
jgi:putative endonuclease